MISTDKLEYKFSQGNTRVHILCMYAIYVRMYVYVYDECSHISFSMRIMVGRCKNNSLAVFSLLVMSKVVQFKKKKKPKNTCGVTYRLIHMPFSLDRYWSIVITFVACYII